jgi:hypothetical protein
LRPEGSATLSDKYGVVLWSRLDGRGVNSVRGKKSFDIGFCGGLNFFWCVEIIEVQDGLGYVS